MEEYALVALAQPEQVAHLFGRATDDVAQRHDDTLSVRQRVKSLSQARTSLARQQALLGNIAERLRWRGPMPRPWIVAVPEPLRRNGGLVTFDLESGEGKRSRLADTARLRLVREDAEEPRLQARAALEAFDSVENRKPGLLHDLLGNGASTDEVQRQAQEGGRISVDKLLEGTLIAPSKRCDEPGIVGMSPTGGDLGKGPGRLQAVSLAGRLPKTKRPSEAAP